MCKGDEILMEAGNTQQHQPDASIIVPPHCLKYCFKETSSTLYLKIFWSARHTEEHQG